MCLVDFSDFSKTKTNQVDGLERKITLVEKHEMPKILQPELNKSLLEIIIKLQNKLIEFLNVCLNNRIENDVILAENLIAKSNLEDTLNDKVNLLVARLQK